MPSLERILRRDQTPWIQTRVANTYDSSRFPELIDNPDPTLRYLACDNERVWRAMEGSEPVIATAKALRKVSLLSVDTGLERGHSSSKRARRIHEWTLSMLKGIREFQASLEMMFDAIMWGWRPLEKVWGPMRWEGRDYLVPKRIHEKFPEHFRFDARGGLVYLPSLNSTGDLKRWEGNALALKFMICTSGAVEHPYGVAVYRDVWLPHFVKNRFLQLFDQGMERSLGLPIFRRRTTTHPGAAGVMEQDPAKIMETVKQEARDMLDLLTSDNILVGLDGWELDFKSDINFVGGWKEALEYYDDLMRSRVAGTDIGSRKGEGSRASDQVTRSTQRDFGKSDARKLESWINEQLIEPAVRWNWDNVQPEEMPKWRSLIHYEMEMENVIALTNAGAPVDGVRTAQVFGVPLQLHPDEGSVILQQKAPPPAAGGPDQTTAPDEERGREEDAPKPEDAERKQSGRSTRGEAPRWDEVELSRFG